MHWCDIAGPPGAGKSFLADAFWHPHAFQPENTLPPASWAPFIDAITGLFDAISAHPTYEAALRMNRRSVRKMATVSRMPGGSPYVQTALLQRGLGFGWRLNDMGEKVSLVRPFFKTMPISIGVVFCTAPQVVIEERNRARLQNPATAHENREHMVPLMLPAIDIAKEVLSDRGVHCLDIDTTAPVAEARERVIDFAAREPFDASQNGFGRQVEVLSTPPPWW
jgi:hypothetical protein